jgi:hypothetical protein
MEALGAVGASPNHGDMFREAVRLAGFDPDQDGIHRMFSGTRPSKDGCLAGTPAIIVAKQADTSVTEIDKHYGRYILAFWNSAIRSHVPECSNSPGQRRCHRPRRGCHWQEC